MRLNELLAGIPVNVKKRGLLDLEVDDITCQSQNAGPGKLFVAIRGDAEDGHRYVAQALEKGAPACLIEQDVEPRFNGSSVLSVNNTRLVFSLLAARIFDYPARDVKILGVTGTNGKTTTAFLLHHLFNYFSSCSMVGTVHHRIGTQVLQSKNTTPGPYDLEWMIAQMRKIKNRYCSMEVSSHSIEQERIAHLEFRAAIFTNLSHEHLDYHKDLDSYFQSKRKLFTRSPAPERMYVNLDDAWGERLCLTVRGKPVTFGLKKRADFMAHAIEVRLDGVSFEVSVEGVSYPVRLKMPCLHNVYNALAAFACAYDEGWDPGEISKVLGVFNGVPGRMERVCPESDFYCFVDYAHTPQAFESVLGSVRSLAKRKVITVFGCGGNRDAVKRAPMGRTASLYSDVLILTSDNPRFEDPETILDQIELGVDRSAGKPVYRIQDRAEAIDKALSLAKRDDVVLVLGKGHETYQIVGEKRFAFDDREEIRKNIHRRSYVHV